MSVDVPAPPEERATLTGLSETASPEEGVAKVDRLTVPVKLLRLPKLMVDDAEPPVENDTFVGFAESEKSPTLTVTGEEWEREPLTPVTVTV